jgi:uncharacterized membrane protein
MEFRVRALGQAASGNIQVAHDHVRLEVTLPWLLHQFGEAVQKIFNSRANPARKEVAAMEQAQRHFPKSAGILFGLGLGGFFDGIVLHQLLQWHHMLSSWYPVNTIENLELNTLWDGIFHSSTYLFVVAGLFVLWRSAQRRHLFWSSKLLAGTMLLGFGIFNTVEGIIDHHILGIHHVNETVAREYWVYWDIGFTLSGIILIAIGWLLIRRGDRESGTVPAGSA